MYIQKSNFLYRNFPVSAWKFAEKYIASIVR